MSKFPICFDVSLFQYAFQKGGRKTWQLGVDLTALLFLFCFFCDVLFIQLKIHLGSSWLANLSSIFPQIIVFNSFCVFSNCNGLFASHFVTVTCVREMLSHFPSPSAAHTRIFLSTFLFFHLLHSLLYYFKRLLAGSSQSWLFQRTPISDQCPPSDAS